MAPRTVTFHFENRTIEGVEGEPIAKALFIAGVRTLSWSVKYKRPRGIHCARGRCIMCHMEVDGVPGVPTCITPLTGGMRVRRENFRPFFAPFLIATVRRLRFPAGFYYRMFTRPGFLRKLFLGSLRRMAGVGRVITENANVRARTRRPALRAPADSYEVIVVGAGLSGLSAALSAANRGAGVLLVDEYDRPGGHSIGHQSDPEFISQRDQCIAQMEFNPAIDYCPRTTAQAFYPPDSLLLGTGGALAPRQLTAEGSAEARPHRVALSGGMKIVRGRTFIFATGAYDVVPVFEDNDRAGIFGPRAVRLLLERDRLIPGRRAVAYGVGDSLRDVTALLAHHGIEIVAVVDAEPEPTGGARVLPAGTRWIQAARVVRTNGGEWLSSVTANGTDRETGRTITESFACDLLCTAFPGQGAYELPYQAGFRFALGEDAVDENRVLEPTGNRVKSGRATCFVVGEAAGHRTWQQKMTAAERSGGKEPQSLESRGKE